MRSTATSSLRFLPRRVLEPPHPAEENGAGNTNDISGATENQPSLHAEETGVFIRRHNQIGNLTFDVGSPQPILGDVFKIEPTPLRNMRRPGRELSCSARFSNTRQRKQARRSDYCHLFDYRFRLVNHCQVDNEDRRRRRQIGCDFGRLRAGAQRELQARQF